MRLLVLVFALFWAGAAAAQEPGRFYGGVHAGALFVQDSDVEQNGASGTFEFDPGFSVGGFGGYRFGNGVRLEGEYTYRRADTDDLCAGGTCISQTAASLNGHVDAHALMGNIWFEPRVGKSLLPYAGGGIGVGFVGYDGSVSLNGINLGSGSDTDTVFAYQAGVGLGYELFDHYVISADYRYWATTDANFNGANAEIGTHNVMVGGRYQF